MIYYPKSNITPNLYSQGALSYKNSNEVYNGFYFTTYDGLAYTGRFPGDGANLELEFPIGDSNIGNANLHESPTTERDYRFVGTDNFKYSSLLGINPNTPPIDSAPLVFYPKPTEADYQTGEIQRYFAKKVNENIYYETRVLFQTNLYLGFSIPWLITGNKDNVAKVNQRIVALKEAELKIIGLGIYLKNNYIQFYK
jgi:hypothetical protein